MKRLYCVFFLTLFVLSCFGQNLFYRYTTTQLYGAALIETTHGYLCVGQAQINEIDGGVLLLDTLGNLIRHATLQYSGYEDDLVSVAADTLGFAIAGGNINPVTVSDYAIGTLVKLDSIGDPVWSKKIVTPGMHVQVRDVCRMHSGHYVALVECSTNSGTSIMPVMLEVDALGTPLQQVKMFNGQLDGSALKIISTQDGGVLVLMNQSQILNYSAYLFLVKYDANLQQQWMKMINPDYFNDRCLGYDVLQKGNGNYVVCGSFKDVALNTAARPFVVETDPAGSVLTACKYSISASGNDRFGEIELLKNGNVMTRMSNNIVTVINTTPSLHTLVWSKDFFNAANYFGLRNMCGASNGSSLLLGAFIGTGALLGDAVVQRVGAAGSTVCGGTTVAMYDSLFGMHDLSSPLPDSATTMLSFQSYPLTVVNYTGWVNYCSVGMDEQNSALQGIQLAPNPSFGAFRVAIGSSHEPLVVQIVNGLGQTVQEISNYRGEEIQLPADQHGLFLIRASTSAGVFCNRLLVE